MISSEDIGKYISNPSSIPAGSGSDIQDWMQKYPYSSSLYMLYVKAQKISGALDFEEALKVSAAHSTDRERLKELIEEVQTEVVEKEIATTTEETSAQKVEEKVEELPEVIVEKEEIIQEEKNESPALEADEIELSVPVEDTNSSKDENVDELQEEESAIDELEESILTHSINIAYELSPDEILGEKISADLPLETESNEEESISFRFKREEDVEATEPKETEEPPSIDLSKLSFVDWLKYKQGQRSESSTQFNEPLDLSEELVSSKDSQEFFDPVKKARESLIESEDLVSETLAEIHVLQKNFGKAIEAYEQLILIYPEKKAIFASRIKEINDSLRK